jgi:hypothetical protein
MDQILKEEEDHQDGEEEENETCYYILGNGQKRSV